MANIKEFGEIEKISYGMKQFMWKIPNFFKVVEDDENQCLASSFFSATDALWQLRLWPRWNLTHKFMDLYLSCKSYHLHERYENCDFVPHADQNYSVKYDFGLKKRDESVQILLSGIVKINTSGNDRCKFIKKTQLLEQKSELVPGNVLTIVCIMSWETVLDKPEPLNLIRIDKLSENFKDFSADKESCDVILKVKDKEYKAHKSVLMARSSVFAASFNDKLKKQTRVINITDCDPDSFQEFLDYLYCGKLEDISLRSARNLCYTANKYDVKELTIFCIQYLLQCLSVENICQIAMFANQYDDAELFEAVQVFFNKKYFEIFLTSEWEHLMKNDYRLANKLLSEMAKKKLNKKAS